MSQEGKDHRIVMAGTIIIERLEFQGRCGVTQEERQRPQPLAVDLELTCQTEPAAASDDIRCTIDYAQVAHQIIKLAATQDFSLLETFTERILAMLFAEFPIDHAKIWLRKLAPPLKLVSRSVGVQLERSRLAPQIHGGELSPARFLSQQLHRLPKGTALDLASGSGRNSLYLASQGFHVEAIDRNEQALTELVTTAKQRNLSNLHVQVVDLERATSEWPELPSQTYDVIVVFFYLHRPLFPALIQSLKPNGILLYETFTLDNHVRHKHPRRAEFCLAQNELLRLTSGLRVLAYDEGEHDGCQGPESAFTAQLLAQRAGPDSQLEASV
ncbi:MAG: Tellurite methyltransferase [Nitrospira sp.]|nr:Tellurite methyltransferase [Nitrospira sp.]